MEKLASRLTRLLILLAFFQATTALKCYECENCNDDGNLVTCANEFTNCYIVFGYYKNFMGLKKGCDKSRSKLGSTFCESTPSTTFEGVVFEKTTSCLCGSDGCNKVFNLAEVQFLSSQNYAEEMKNNLKCLQCNPCTGAGVIVTCPDSTKNCFQSVGMLEGNQRLVKGCAPLSGLPKQESLTCSKLNEAPAFNSTLIDATECLCSTDNCNTLTAGDPLPEPSTFKCYVCDGACQGEGEVKECPKDLTSCYIANNGTSTFRGCYNTSVPSTNYVCKNHTNVTVDGKLHAFITLCPCSKASCNKDFPQLSTNDETTKELKPTETGFRSCYYCSNCVDGGVSQTCPKGLLNCFYAEGNDKNGKLVKQKGCVPEDFKLSNALQSVQTLIFKTREFQNETYTNVKVVACGTDNCNDQMVQKLECYQCEMCTNNEELVTCSAQSLNCFVMSGRKGLFKVRAKGCETSVSFALPQPVCNRYAEVDFSGYKFKKALACACPTSKCNADIIPFGAIITNASSTPIVSTLLLISTLFLVHILKQYI